MSTSNPFVGRLPKLAAFDLDYTCWDLYIEFYSLPIQNKNVDINKAVDRSGQNIRFYPELPSILLEIHRAGSELAVASRTHATDEAMAALKELKIPGCLNSDPPNAGIKNVSALSLFGVTEIYPGSKISHFKEIHKKTGIPYNEMIFFDDEPRNKEVETKLGVHFVLVKNGMTRKLAEKGFADWRKKNSIEEIDSE